MMVRYWHKVGGNLYGTSLEGETLEQYKDRVKAAYGGLRGVSFVMPQSEIRADKRTTWIEAQEHKP